MKTISLISAGVLATTMQLHAETLTRDNGAPVGDNQNSKTAGAGGGVLLDDVHLIQKLQRFARERIPERVVHARGTGAHGEFVSSGDFSNLTSASFLNHADKKTPVFVRFSTVVHGKGSPETLRDPRGFATKFYTDEGNWDLVGNNLPVFFIRDAIKFPDMVHSLKPSPVTNVQDPNRFFDFFSHEPGATNMLTWVYSDRGTPASYRKMDGFGVHAYKMVNPQGQVRYVKFQWKSQQGIETLTAKNAAKTQGMDFNNLTNDLYQAINAGDHPKWDLYVKVLKPEQLDDFSFNPLDATKIWPKVPEQKLGTMTLNRVPDNFFQASELSAFSPANLVTGIEPSEDRLLQGRMFAYSDTQLYRLGANHQQLPINRARATVANHNQDGAMNMGDSTSDVNYEPSRKRPLEVKENARYSETPLAGATLQRAISKQDNFTQAGDLYRSFSGSQKANLISNLAGDLGQVKDTETRQIMLSYFYRADADFGKRLTKALNENIKAVKNLAAR
ncbi:Catalase [BD1-7 clade bacterium]|uniref:Catalase n=1 Tax=BD1-7 clade bacterium TaxID=2029982 RepID=A0A5S9NJI7_9GAMM|nr:Catalase [BD1-7 clade bacterium]CAA0093617.1 Catalase [BD1-7 clade bacterium]